MRGSQELRKGMTERPKTGPPSGGAMHVSPKTGHRPMRQPDHPSCRSDSLLKRSSIAFNAAIALLPCSWLDAY